MKAPRTPIKDLWIIDAIVIDNEIEKLESLDKSNISDYEIGQIRTLINIKRKVSCRASRLMVSAVKGFRYVKLEDNIQIDVQVNNKKVKTPIDSLWVINFKQIEDDIAKLESKVKLTPDETGQIKALLLIKIKILEFNWSIKKLVHRLLKGKRRTTIERLLNKSVVL